MHADMELAYNRTPMFDQLTQRLGATLDALRGRRRITEENVADALRQVRVALLEADVALPVVKSFIESVRARAIGAEAVMDPDLAAWVPNAMFTMAGVVLLARVRT